MSNKIYKYSKKHTCSDGKIYLNYPGAKQHESVLFARDRLRDEIIQKTTSPEDLFPVVEGLIESVLDHLFVEHDIMKVATLTKLFPISGEELRLRIKTRTISKSKEVVE